MDTYIFQYLRYAYKIANTFAYRYNLCADDLRGEVSLALVVSANTYTEDKGAFLGYAKKRIVGACLDYIEREKFPRGFREKRENAPRTTHDVPDIAIIDPETDDFLDLIKHLKPAEQLLLTLKYHDGLTGLEMVKRLGISRSVIVSRHTKIIQKLRGTHARSKA